MRSLFLKLTKRVKSSLSPFILLLLFISNVNAANGLLGQYYNGNNFDTLQLTRIDSTINFDWDNGSPDSSINNDLFSIIWTGYIDIPERANYTFYVAHDDYMKVTINGTQHYESSDWTGGEEEYKTFTINNFRAGRYPIEIRFKEGWGGAYARFAWENSKSISTRTIVPSSNLWTPPVFTISDATIAEGNSGYSDMNFTVTISESANASVSYATTNGTAEAGSDYNATSGILSFTLGGATSKTISVPIKGDTVVESNEVFTLTLSNAANATILTSSATGTITNDDMAYCGTNALSTGFHVVNPFNDINKSIEIFCYNNRDFIALPIKNNSNNFVFNTDALSTTHYYNEASSNASHFEAIEINAYTLKVLANTAVKLPQTINAPTAFNVMGASFSNINLTGTPFAIDWTNTTISNCTQAKLRTAYYGQDVKINTLDYDSKAICNIESMQLKLLDDYRYLAYEGTEVLQKSCKTMAESVPTSFLDSSLIQGHYWISPFSQARTYNQTNIKSDNRPIVVYCWYQTDLDWVWTFSLAMDGKVTNKKSDLVNKADTCSEFGLFPFVANNEKTFERVREFLYDKKNQWNNYTGTIEEKYNVFMNDHYYLRLEQNSIIWPYGSFGVYFPYNGNRDSTAASKTWKGDSNSDPGWMSGSPMHNMKSITTDYARLNNDEGNAKRDYYSWGINRTEIDITDAQAAYSDTDTNRTDGNYPYEATMGAKGWVSILGAADLNKTNEWFISKAGAGVNFDHSIDSIGDQHPYYEPNGNYTAEAWLNFLFDSDGRVRHLDDYDARYAYYDYMCMAEDNYDFTTRYGLIVGPFIIIEHDVPAGSEVANTNISTKIVNEQIRLDIAILNEDLSAVSDKNVSVGIFMNDTEVVGSTEQARDRYYFGDLKLDGTGSLNSFKTAGAGRFELPPSAWPIGVQTWAQAEKQLFFKFKYCSRNDYEWTQCWTRTGNTATCTPGQESYCKSVDSRDDFAVRPKNFSFNVVGTAPYKAGKAYNITFTAKDGANAPTANYNEAIPFSYEEATAGCIVGDFNSTFPNMQFSEGSKTLTDLSYSEVGKINVKMEETEGSEFAKIDDDTPWESRRITPYDQNWSYTPDHFEINATMSSGGNGYTYISADLNMSLILDFDVTAKTENNATTKNYNSACYAKVTDYVLSHNTLNLSPAAALTRFNFSETNTDTNSTALLANTLNLNDLNTSIFSTDHNGTGKAKLKINFDRNVSKVVNPFILTITDINVTDADTIKGARSETNTTDLNATFYYGRVHATDYRGRSPITASIDYEVYCNGCNRPNFNIAGAQSPDSFVWYRNTLHTDLSDGNVTNFGSLSGRTGLTPNASNNIATGRENNVLTNANAPDTDRIQMTPSSWLIYNAFNVNAITNDFNVEFQRSGTWAGQGNLGQTVDINASVRTYRKMEW